MQYVQDSRAGEIASIPEIRSSHHVLRVEHLLSQVWNANGTEGMGTTAGQRSEADHEEVETRERNHVDGELTQIRVELAREAKASSNAGHNGGNKVVEVTVGGVAEFESAEADVVQSLSGVSLQSQIRRM